MFVRPTSLAIAAAIASSVGCAAARAQQPIPSPAPAMQAPAGAVPQVVTNGQGEARIVPDRARLELSVQTRGATAAGAGSDNARRQQAVLAALRKLGFESAQLSTVNYNLYPEMRYDQNGQQPRVTGYVATNTVRVEVKDVGMIGRAIDASLEAGANMVSSLAFYSANTDAARRSALAEAVARARDDADAVARAAGGSIGALLELTTTDFRLPVIYNRVLAAESMAGKAAGPTPVEPGEQTISATVTARWMFVAGR